LWLDAVTPHGQLIEAAIVRQGSASLDAGADLRLAIRQAHVFPTP